MNKLEAVSRLRQDTGSSDQANAQSLHMGNACSTTWSDVEVKRQSVGEIPLGKSREDR